MYVIGYIVALVTSYSMKMIITNWALFFMPLFEHELVSGLNFAKNSFICCQPVFLVTKKILRNRKLATICTPSKLSKKKSNFIYMKLN